jgi:putative transposase
MGNCYRIEPTPAAGSEQSVERKSRARKRPKGALTHVRSWPLRPDPAQCRVIRTRFFVGVRAYNAVLGEFIARSRAVKSDPVWQATRQLPRRTKDERVARRAAFDAVVVAHGFTASQAQSFASSLRGSWVREHLWHRESPQFHRGEDVKDSPSEPADCGGPPSTWSRLRISLCHEGCATTRAGHCPGRR